MKFTSPVYSAVSGSVAGLTYSHNRGGMYVRARAIPTNPNTDPQVAARTAMRNGVIAWGDLTDAQRGAWDDYGANTPMLDKLGASRPLTGQQQYLRSWLARTAVGASTALLTVAPTTFDLGTFTPVTFVASAATDDVTATFDDGDAWANGIGGFLSIAIGIQQNGSRNFYKNPFAIAGFVLGNVVPPTSPEVIAYGSPLTLGNALWVQYVVGQQDGRTSTPIIERLIVTT